MSRRAYGSGSVRRYETSKGVRWSYSHWIETRTGQRKQVKKGGFATKRDAEKALREALAERDRGLLLEPSMVTVEQYATEVYLPFAARKIRPHTAYNYQRAMRIWVFPHLGSVPLQKVTPAQITGMLDALTQKPSTKRLALVLLSAMFSLAVAEGLLVRNPAKHPTVVPPPLPRWDGTLWTPNQVREFLEATKDHPLFPVFRVLSHTGMRRAEVMALRWSDVDLDEGHLIVSRSLTWLHGEPTWAEGKTNSSRRMVTLDPGTVEVLRQHRQQERQRWFMLGQPWDEERLLFTTAKGQPIRPDLVTRQFGVLSQKHGLPKTRLHDLRHLYATLALEAGVPLKVVSEHLGHSSVSITADRYMTVRDEVARAANQRVADVLSGTNEAKAG